MKVVHLIDYFQPKLGYQEFFLAREHQKLGHEVQVVTSDRYYPFANYKRTFQKLLGNRVVGSGRTIEETVETVRLPSLEIPNSPLIYLFGLGKKLKEIQPSAIFCHGVFSITSFFAAYFKPQVGYKLIYDNHAANFNTNLSDTIPKKLYLFLYQKLFQTRIKQQADAFFAIGEEEQSFLCEKLRLNKSHVSIIRLGVDTERFKFSKTQRLKIRSKFKLSENDILIIFAGKIEPRKDIHILIKALQMIDNNNLHLILVGDGEDGYIRELKKLAIKLNTHWTHFVENTKLPEYYSAADIGVFAGDPTITILEAMACRLPLILPNYFGTKYLDKSGGVYRFHRRNTYELRKRLRELADSETLRRMMGINGERFIQNKLSWSIIARQTLKLLY